MFNDYIKIKDKKIPQTSLGTAPFIGMPYFGHRSRLYQLDFHNSPENILKIMKKSHEMGVQAIQLIPEEPVVKALELAQDEGIKFDIWGTVRKDNLDEDIQLLSSLEASMMLLDEWVTDKSDINFIEESLNKINDENVVSGLITALPKETTPKLIDSDINDFDIYMIPVNKLGYMMDYPVFMHEERAELAELLRKLNKVVIANKILAVGILNPEEAMDFLKTLDYVDMVTLGVASEKEAEETFNLLFNK
ncbi:MAG: hypothetical protein Q7U35_01080 [Methanobacteriaceae archaeon]|nr:hypothetical protein [Methanobacteriaceae archaeon]MDP2837121.1 hypothetical protein [Methanobacteriaceae archaeon]MDP3035646.1 hypothetical protein [Methanobacteriaceae archaeon]MDP3485654.1 hypothetical protein [Methanobacteriaceae archaeon]MDP3624078.1 hypothetical protein [Methanobacteriaceae archaeon]